MEGDESILNEVVSESYDTTNRPFDFVRGRGATALVCESDPAILEKINNNLAEIGYHITTPVTAKDALRIMRFHIFDIVVLNELFDTSDPQANSVLQYQENMMMTTRRRFFVALVSDTYRTMDNLAAFNRSVNVVINLKDIDTIGKIIKQAVVDNKIFYHVFQETLQKMRKA